MNRRNYGLRSRRTMGSSGTILDYCRDHGLWFEAGELDHILAWLRNGSPPDETETSPRSPSRGQPLAPGTPTGSTPTGNPVGGWELADGFLSAVGWLAEALFDAG